MDNINQKSKINKKDKLTIGFSKENGKILLHGM